MITVRLPSNLRRPGAPAELSIGEPVATLGELVATLRQRHPYLSETLDDNLFNFAVNDALVLHGMRDHPLAPGDTVEIIPAISGGK